MLTGLLLLVLVCLFVYCLCCVCLFVFVLAQEERRIHADGLAPAAPLFPSRRILHGISTGLFQGFSPLKFFMGFHRECFKYSSNQIFYVFSNILAQVLHGILSRLENVLKILDIAYF